MANLSRAHGAVGQSVMQFLGWFQGGKMAFIPLNSERFLEMMSELAVGWLLLEQAALAIEKLGSVSESHPDHAFYLGKKYAAIYFAKNVLSLVPSKAKIIATADTSPNDIPDEAFATV